MIIKEDRLGVKLIDVPEETRIALSQFMWAHREGLEVLFSEVQPGLTFDNLYFPEWKFLP